jgi:quinol monooxygenase YgiN
VVSVSDGAPRRLMVATIRMRVRPEKRLEFVQAMTDLAARARRAVGCVAAHFFADGEDPDRFMLVEEWRRRRDLDRHLNSEEFAVVMGTRFLLAGVAEITLDLVSHQANTDEVLRRRANAKRSRRRGKDEPRPRTGAPSSSHGPMTASS